MLSKHHARVAEYRAKAQAEQDRADACLLQQPRQRHGIAAAAWTELADSEERNIRNLARRLDRAAPGAEPAASCPTA